MTWERINALFYTCYDEYLDGKSFFVLSVKGRNICINTRGLIRLTMHGAFCQRECISGTERRLELKPPMGLPLPCNLGALEYV